MFGRGETKLQPVYVEDVAEELREYWLAQEGHQVIATTPELAQILIAANRDPREVSRALARALVACLISSATTEAPLRFSLAPDGSPQRH
jgi:hypothetical protein